MLTAKQDDDLRQGAAAFGVSLDDAAVARFGVLAEMLECANRSVNLTRIPAADFVPLHFLDSLAVASVLSPAPGSRWIDVGTGAGFPGLPLAITFPEIEVTLLDATRKKLDYIDGVVARLELANVHTLHGRAEEIGRSNGHADRYDVATARAVARLNLLARWMLPLVRHAGAAVALKGADVSAEAAEAGSELSKLGGSLEQVKAVALPGTEITRTIVVIRKQAGRQPSPAPTRRNR